MKRTVRLICKSSNFFLSNINNLLKERTPIASLHPTQPSSLAHSPFSALQFSEGRKWKCVQESEETGDR